MFFQINKSILKRVDTTKVDQLNIWYALIEMNDEGGQKKEAKICPKNYWQRLSPQNQGLCEVFLGGEVHGPPDTQSTTIFQVNIGSLGLPRLRKYFWAVPLQKIYKLFHTKKIKTHHCSNDNRGQQQLILTSAKMTIVARQLTPANASKPQLLQGKKTKKKPKACPRLAAVRN